MSPDFSALLLPKVFVIHLQICLTTIDITSTPPASSFAILSRSLGSGRTPVPCMLVHWNEDCSRSAEFLDIFAIFREVLQLWELDLQPAVAVQGVLVEWCVLMRQTDQQGDEAGRSQQVASTSAAFSLTMQLSLFSLNCVHLVTFPSTPWNYPVKCQGTCFVSCLLPRVVVSLPSSFY